MAGTAAVASGVIEMLKEDHARVKGLSDRREATALAETL